MAVEESQDREKGRRDAAAYGRRNRRIVRLFHLPFLHDENTRWRVLRCEQELSPRKQSYLYQRECLHIPMIGR